MTQPNPMDNDLLVWSRLVETHLAYLSASKDFFAEGIDRVMMVRKALREAKGVMTACHVLKYLKPAELESLFDLLVEWSSTGHGLVHVFREAIVSMPRGWVLAHIEDASEPILREGTYDEFRRFLELYNELDRGLAEKLAHRAAKHPDEDIREAGEDFLEILNEEGPPRSGRVAHLGGEEGVTLILKTSHSSEREAGSEVQQPESFSTPPDNSK